MMADDNKEMLGYMDAQPSSPTDIDFVVQREAIPEESTQNGSNIISGDEQNETERIESETDEVIFPSKVKKNRNRVVLDSDEEDVMPEHGKNLPSHFNKTIISPHSDEKNFENEIHTSDFSQPDGNVKKKITKKSRIKPIWTSEHNDEDSSDNEINGNLSSHFSDQDSDKVQTNLCVKKVKSVKKKLIKKQHFSSESDDGNSSASENENKESSSIKPTWNSEVDSDGSCEGDDLIKEKNNSNVSPRVRKLKKKPNEDIQKIRSESQRMVRESTVCLPYHKPKQRSLLEFLNRKRVNSEDCVKPRPRDVGPVMQVLEDRVKEIEEFFKSDSEESENETEKKNTIPLLDQEELLSANPKLSSMVDSFPNFTSVENLPEEPDKMFLDFEKKQSNTASYAAESSFQPVSQENDDIPSNCIVSQEKADASSSLDNANHEAKDSTDIISDGSNDSWLNISSVFSHKEKVENIKRLSVAKVNKPTLHGRPGQLLDFHFEDTSIPDQKEKVNNLIERFVQQVTNTKKSPRKKDVQISIVHKVMNADGQLELKRDVLNVPVENTSSECASAGRRQLLKDSLRESISAKRAVDRMKKTENQQIENEDFSSDEKLDSEPEEEILTDDPETDEDEDVYGYEHKERKKKRKNIFVDEEAEDSDENDFEDDDTGKIKSVIEHSGAQSDEEHSLTEYELRIKKNYSQSDDNVSVSRSDMKLNLKNSGRFSSFEDLTPNFNESDDSSEDLIPRIDGTQNNDASNVEELLALCSGKFPDSTGADSQKSHLNQMVNDDEFEEDAVKPFSRIIPMVDDDDDSSSSCLKLQVENYSDESKNAPLLMDDEEEKSKPNRKKRARICLSDDEDENGDEERSIADEEDMHEEEREFRGLTDFFEDEAELSGSEVGSGDEREDEVDDWEEEEGDKEDIDENELREQVGRAHMKTLLDQDQRDVRLFQELFLEDGDLHSDGGGRQRQFRWKNADSEENEDNRPKTQEEDAEEGTEEQDDLTWRKMRSEREKWLQQQKSQQEVNKDVPLVMKRNGKMVKVNTKASSNAIEKTDSSAAVVNLNQYTSPKKNIAATVRRGSFLRRSEKDLSAIASLTKSVLPVQASRTGSNFVFASITPERPAVEEKRKFKQEGSKCSSSNQNPAPAKKAKVSLSTKSIFSYF